MVRNDLSSDLCQSDPVEVQDSAPAPGWDLSGCCGLWHGGPIPLWFRQGLCTGWDGGQRRESDQTAEHQGGGTTTQGSGQENYDSPTGVLIE